MLVMKIMRGGHLSEEGVIPAVELLEVPKGTTFDPPHIALLDTVMLNRGDVSHDLRQHNEMGQGGHCYHLHQVLRGHSHQTKEE